MKKNKKIVVTIIIIILLIATGAVIYLTTFKNSNQLNIKEKEWIDKNKTSIVTVNLPNNLNVFSTDGKGTVNEFFDELSKEYGISINKNVSDYKTNTSLGLTVSESKPEEGLLLFTDHYVLISKNRELINEPADLNGKKIGGLNDGIAYISKGYKITSTFVTYESDTALAQGLEDKAIDYALVPLNEYIDKILEKNYIITYHLPELKKYYYIHLGTDEILNSIVNKFYNIWYNDEYEKSYYTNLYNLFVEKLALTGLDTDKLTSKTYKIGFTENPAYTSLSGNKTGGILFSYLTDFSKFVNTDFTYTKYKTDSSLIKAYNNKDVDIMINNTDETLNDYTIKLNLPYKYYIINNYENSNKVSDISYVSDTVYVIKGSKLANYLDSKTTTKQVKNISHLIKTYNKGYTIAIDANAYNLYHNKKIKNSIINYSGYIPNNMEFRYQTNDDAFYKLFSNYSLFLDDNKILSEGLDTYSQTNAQENIAGVVAKYILVAVSIGVIIIGIVIASKKHVKLDTKIRKDEKLKFIDMLTSLKNRNYLNEKMDVWNKNTIYPQAVIVIDLNNLKYINDTFGHEEGDKQIKASAGILIKTQLDNSEIMRTDGNEFMVYLVGYTEKQVINYIKKLVKEFKTLPYEYGAAIGFSMIVDDLKLLDDAINEASIQMRENKETIETNEKES